MSGWFIAAFVVCGISFLPAASFALWALWQLIRAPWTGWDDGGDEW